MSKLPKCRLSNTDGNVFSVIGAVRRTLRKAGLIDQVGEFTDKAKTCQSYDDVLNLCFKYVDVA